MPNDNCQKIKLLKLMEMLRQETDENHPMTTGEICRRLGEMGISCERRTVGKDIKVLRENGFEIMSELSGHENSYWISDRSFDLPELKILMDAVQAAHFIPEDKTEQLVAKIAALGGSHQAELLQGNIVQFNAHKHSNYSIFYNVQEIENAIQSNKRVSFRYFDLDENLTRVYRFDGGRYNTEPLMLVFEDNNYYLLTYSAKYDHITPYRMDRMDQVRVEEESISETALIKKEDGANAVEQAFRMYMGEMKTVTVRFCDRLIGVMYDKFGEELRVSRIDSDICEAEVDVQISPPFWGWLLQYPKDLVLIAPEDVREEYAKQLSAALEKQNHNSGFMND